MFKIKFYLIALLFLPVIVSAQCVTSFSVIDSTCPLKDISVINNDNSGAQYAWDFCPGDLFNMPANNNLTIPPGFGNSPEQLRIIQENNQYYGFLANYGYTYLVRVNFGSSLNNTPTYDTLEHNSIINGHTGIDLVKENGKWQVFVVINSPARLVRLELDSITDLSPVFTDITVPGMSSPLEIRVKDHFAFITDLSGTLHRYNFNGNYQNIPTQVTPAINQPTLFGVDVVYDCKTNSYYGVTATLGNGGVALYNFGNDMSSTPVLMGILTFSAPARGVSFAYENNQWYLSATLTNDHFAICNFGTSITSLPAIINDTDLGGGALNSSFSCQLIKDQSDWHFFALNVNSNSLFSHFTFPAANCSASLPSSYGLTPQGINYNATASGYYYFDVTVTDSNANQQIFTDSVFITTLPPVAAFSHGPTCANTVVQFYDSSEICFGNIIAWNWDFGDGNSSSLKNPQHLFTATGIYTVTLTAYSANNDSSSLSQIITIVDYPVSDFTFVNSVCSGTNITFTDLSQNTGDTVTSWIWSFGDNDTSQQQNPDHIYTAGGNYSAELIATNSKGCSDTIAKTVNILNAPNIGFSFTHTCSNDLTVFTNTTDTAGLNTTYLWDFGDSNSDNTKNPSHNYINSGNYTVALIAISSNTCSDTLQQNIVISDKAIPDFILSDTLICTGSTIDFIDISTSGANPVIYRKWDFGDSATLDSLAIASHSYLNPGNYTITLYIATPSYCDTSIQKNISVLQSPTSGFTYTNECFGNAVNFTNTTTQTPGDPVVQYLWNLGDSTFAYSPDTSNNYNGPGVYEVTLTAISQIGCTDSITHPVTIYEIPVAAFTNYPLLCTDTIATFIDLSFINNDTLNSWSWDFGDGQVSTDQNPVHIYTTAGTKLVTLTTGSIHGCTNSISQIISINASPVPQFTFTPTCFGETTCFTATVGNHSGNYIQSWQWNFGDNSISQTQNPCHTYSSTGSNTITLQVTDTNNCRSITTAIADVNPVPQASFSTTNPCTNTSFQLIDESTISSGNINNWQWIINNDSAGTTSSINYITESAGLLPVTIIVSSDKSCSDTLTEYISVLVSPVSQFSMTPLISAPGELVSFTNSSLLADTYQWELGDGSNDTDSSITHIYNDTGMYIVSLITINNNGCSDTLQKFHPVVIPAVDIAILDFTKTISNGLLTLTATIFNSSNVDISNFEIIAEVEGINAIHEFPQLYIPLASSPKNYTFQSSFQLNGEDPGYICIEIKNPNGLPDADDSNNRICKSNSEQFEILSISPNPVNNICDLNFNMPAKGNADLEIINSEGQQVIITTLTDLKKGYNSKSLNLNALSQGVYTVVLRINDEIKTYQLVKSN